MENRGKFSVSHYRSARLALPNEFPARDRAFITKLSEELHLNVGWDEYDQDRNLVTWRFPRLSHQVEREKGGEEMVIERDGSTSNSEWEDELSGDDDEAHAAVDRALKKYEKAPVVDLDAQGRFDERHERSVKKKMDEWKRGYYIIRYVF
jgi:5'-3' exoribonuclease 1